MLGLMEWGRHPNISDLSPWLKRFDLQGLRKKMYRDMEKALEIATRWVEERVEKRRREVAHLDMGRKDFLDVLLDHHEGTSKYELERMSQRNITIFILKMTRTKDEIASVIGQDQKLEESSVESLTYLQAVVKETLRLHAPIPFLVPRKAGQDTNFMGYHIPKGTQLFVNAWAIGRDPECWENPNSFEPERFLGSKVDYKGHHFELISFGAGRRMCAGVPLAQRVLHLVLGSLLHEFDWELESHVNAETLDINDKIGIVVRKLDPLKVIPKKSELILVICKFIKLLYIPDYIQV
ncbi:cytochrome P450 [Artemisia annua]|uniref:Cytochrome P450 n=1 Tax=Artemisia annua TaxID=35608 RepID=A0A2U1P1M7_ARTAN|nr:cytochrome P450 [Artemisia annua]